MIRDAVVAALTLVVVAVIAYQARQIGALKTALSESREFEVGLHAGYQPFIKDMRAHQERMRAEHRRMIESLERIEGK